MVNTRYYLVAAAALMLCLGAAAAATTDKPLSNLCLGCLCEAQSGCNQTAGCHLGACGPFRITYPYWVDGGKLVVNNDAAGSEEAYINCANDIYCAADTVQNYMKKFSQDCNDDNVVDCYDFASIHKLGAFGCHGILNYEFDTTLNNCLNTHSNPSAAKGQK